MNEQIVFPLLVEVEKEAFKQKGLKRFWWMENI